MLFEQVLSQKSKIFESALNDPRLSFCIFWRLASEDWIGVRGKSLEKSFKAGVCERSLKYLWTHSFVLVFKLFNFNAKIRLGSLHRFPSLFGYLAGTVDEFIIVFLLNCAAPEGVTKLFLSNLLTVILFLNVVGNELGVVNLIVNLLFKSCLDYGKSLRDRLRRHNDKI
jgi:hypothetical protein